MMDRPSVQVCYQRSAVYFPACLSLWKTSNAAGVLKKNIRVATEFCLFADMAVHNFVGDAFRGATWVALHNGGGVGW